MRTAIHQLLYYRDSGTQIESLRLPQNNLCHDARNDPGRTKYLMTMFFGEDVQTAHEAGPCSAIGCTEHGSKLCGSCGRTSYCNVVCQRRHWRIHKTSCLRKNTDELIPFDEVLTRISELSRMWIESEGTRNTSQSLQILKHLLSFAVYQYGDACPGESYRKRSNGDQVDNMTADIEIWQISSTLGNRLYNLRTKKSYQEAEFYFLKARSYLERWRFLIDAVGDKRVNKLHEMLSITERYLADLYASQSRFSEAASHCASCLDFAKKTVGENHTIELFKALRTFGYLEDRQSNYVGAIGYFEDAYICVSEAYGPVHPRVQEAAGYLTDALLQSKNYAQAEAYARINYESLVDIRNGINPDSFEVARGAQQLVHICYITPPNLCLATVTFAEGEFLARKALRIVEAIFDQDHINIGSSLNDLAKILHESGNLGEETKQLFKRSLSIYVNCEGSDGLLVLEANSNLGAFHVHRSEKSTDTVGKQVELRCALHYFEEVLRISSAVHGRNHPVSEDYSTRIKNLRG